MRVYIAGSSENRRRYNTNSPDRVVKCGLLIRATNGHNTHGEMCDSILHFGGGGGGIRNERAIIKY